MIDNVAFCVNNLVNSATITATTVNAQFPLSNLKDVRRTKVYRATTNSATVTFDLGSTQLVSVVSLISSGVDPISFTSAQFQMSALSDFSVLLHDAPVTIDSTFGFAYASVPNVSARYCRLALSQAAGIVELSKVFIGDYVNLGVQGFEYPLQFRQSNNSTIQKNRLGQRFVDVVNKQKDLSGTISTLNKDEVDDVFSILDSVSNTKPLWIIFPEGNITNNNDRLNGYYYLNQEPQLSFDRGNFWNLSLSLEEGT